jgi:choline dehydrogenase
MSDRNTYDYVIVGGGTAGSVLASRLSEDADVRVLLLEAGPADGPPHMRNPLAWAAMADSEVDWAYRSAPSAGTNGTIHPVPRGRVLGGSSAINGTFHVRGGQAGYDAWEKAGATGWNYDSMLPYLKRSEAAEGDNPDPLWRGMTGPMRVRPMPESNEIWDLGFQAAVEAGHKPSPDGNGEHTVGVSWTEVNVVDGVRQTASDAYLTPAVRARPNLTIITGAEVWRLVIAGGVCTGVTYSGTDGASHLEVANADREVILAAGVIGSPHLLMLSGFGPADHLRANDIDIVADLPGVGANLQDHPMSQIVYATRNPVFDGTARPSHVLAQHPDVQMFFLALAEQPRQLTDRVDPWGSAAWKLRPDNGYSLNFALMTPAARGSVRLDPHDPSGSPIIDLGLLSDERDVDRMIAGLRMTAAVGEAQALNGVRRERLDPVDDLTDDAAARAYLSRTTSSYFHPVGTCTIGVGNDAVVDPQLRLRGIDGLRVIDASVMPSIVSGNTNAAVLAIAERGAAQIRGERLEA